MNGCPVVTGRDPITGEPHHCAEPLRQWTVCPIHANALKQDLAELPGLASDVHRVLTRYRSGAVSGGGRGGETLPFDPHASQALGAIRAVLVAWIRDTDEDPAHHPADELAAMAHWLLARHHHLVSHPAAQEIVREFNEVTTAARRVTIGPPELVFLGHCDCGADLHAPTGRRWVTCRACELVIDGEAKRAEMLAALYDQLVTAAEFAHLASHLGLIPLAGRDRLRQRVNLWAKRGHVIPHRRGEDPAYRYDHLVTLLAANPSNPRKGHHVNTHPQCGKTWTGKRMEHCPACCETFTGTGTGDKHRVGDHGDGTRRCLTAAEMRAAGLVLDSRGIWGTAEYVPRAVPTGRAQIDEPAELAPGLPLAVAGPEIADTEAVA